MVMLTIVFIEILTVTVGLIGGILMENRRRKLVQLHDLEDAYALGKLLLDNYPELRHDTERSAVEFIKRHEKRERFLKNCGLNL